MPATVHTLQACLEDARRHRTRAAWLATNPRAYYAAWRRGWLDRCCAHMVSGYRSHQASRRWTLEKCLASARNFQTKGAWAVSDSRAYQAARLAGWLQACTAHMSGPGGDAGQRLWCVYKLIFSDGEIYVGLTKNLAQRLRAHRQKGRVAGRLRQGASFNCEVVRDRLTAYEAAKFEARLIDELWRSGAPNLLNLNRGGTLSGGARKYTYGRCAQDAQKFATRSQWWKLNRGSCAAAYRNGWINQLMN